jgi:hypothetical protein
LEIGICFESKRKTNNMKTVLVFLLSFITMFLTSCQVIGDIFKAGMWWGIILVVGFIALIIWVISRLGGGNK